MNHTILLNTDSETAAQTVTAILARQGHRVLRSFDLRSALVAHPERVCPCHGTSPCNCQFVVLLVYGRAARPVVVIAHGHDQETSLQLVPDPQERPDPDLAGEVMAAIVEAALSADVASENQQPN
ncbi:MAG: hypothetical protein BroJett011_13690 [Chloroflexota bacterium]|nr:MAG: hypothetical protein BroJett011_13690 [Chloroflexota bacterium]